MRTKVERTSGLNGKIQLMGDKSISHRAALFASIAIGKSQIDNFLDAGVTRVLLNSLTQLGINWTLSDNRLVVEGKGLKGLKESEGSLYCGNSATTIRLLAGAIAAAGIEATLDGSDGLGKRPMGRIIEPLKAMGAPIEGSPDNTTPIIFERRNKNEYLEGQAFNLKVASAQVKTCILLAGLGANSATTLTEPSHSRDHTERMLQLMDVDLVVDPDKNQITLLPNNSKQLNPLNITIPGDISSAAFLIVAALITPNSHIYIENVGLNPTRTGLLDVLIDMGADISITNEHVQHNEPVGTIEVKTSTLSGIEINGARIVRMIDEFPIFAVAAVSAKGRTVVGDAKELRYKETDRISTLVEELKTLGVAIEEKPDGFEIEGGKAISGGLVNGQGDHRLAMSLSVLGLISQTPVFIEGSEIIKESFPNFYQTLNSLGANCSIIDD